MAGDADRQGNETERATDVASYARLGGFDLPLESLLAIVGIVAFLAGTLPELAGRDRLLTTVCLIVALLFALQYAIRLWQVSSSSGSAAYLGRERSRIRLVLSGTALVDLLAAAPVPLALLLGAPGSTARLFGVFWSLKLIRLNPAVALLVRVVKNERQPLLSVTMAFVVIVLFASTAAYIAERASQPEAFASIPAALWWAVTTVTTTGYGDKYPVTFVGRLLGGTLMVCGIGLFALWAGILASGFASELRRREFLQSWDLVVRLPLFRNLGAAALSEVTHLLKVQRVPAGAAIVREGQPGDSMYFIAEGEVEVRAKTARIRLKAGAFFGEMALVKGTPRNATVVAVAPTRLLRLDVVDFHDLAARQPELFKVIETESTRREGG
jgi:voltage-gated potassium channel